MAYGGFGKKSGPTSSTNPNSAHQFFANVAPSPPNPSASIQRSPSPFVQLNQSFGNGPRPFGQSGAQSQGHRPSSSPPMVTSIVASRSSENSVSLKVLRAQQESSGGFNQPAQMRNNFPSGGFRPASVGVVPIRQSVHPRNYSPQLSYNQVVEGYRPSSEARPMTQVARPRNSSPKSFHSRNQPIDFDSFPPLSVGAGSTRHTARPRANAPNLASRNNHIVDLDSFTPFPAAAGSVHNITHPRPNSPELTSRSNQSVDLDNFPPLSSVPGPARYAAHPRTNSPEQVRHQFADLDGFPPPSTGAGSVWPAPVRNSSDSRSRSPVSYANLEAMQNHPPASPNYDVESSQHDCIQGTDQAGYPASQADKIPNFTQTNSKWSSSQSNTLGTISKANSSTQNSQALRKSLPRSSNHVPGAVAANSSSFHAMKRSRSPPVSSNKAPAGNFNDIEDEEREMQAKAKRLARFKVELGEKSRSSNYDTESKGSTNLHDVSIAGKSRLVPEHSPELKDDFSSELEGSSVSGVIIGSCTDMCPESERGERERKGDLDRFERVDGDRNQTSKSLAVKKYTRTAEREAYLIRPMPILQKTMEYLLNLLNQPYNDKFLATYNFLWDRMRAIRMDLRMQHIFNQSAITMLEQMIRLHIIVMHELCEYSKGEGFSEGFDAHLNIEQMNKTSVELFQMYDDHRKKGIAIPSEEEFRGYYALLKLDKHPGYMVEPAELSLDLAKMTPEIRQTEGVLFARDVARACRTGNFIVFFRLARKASYLQACLMHAHFAKLRTQALASLHAGLQNNQGLPVIDAAKWLAMEQEDMESLLEYHGFVIKFDEPYMMKAGPFLNGEKDYDTRCSKLVDMKKSRSIREDVAPSTKVVSPAKAYQRPGKNISPSVAPKEIKMVNKSDNELEVFVSDRKKRPLHDNSPNEASGLVYAVDEDTAVSKRCSVDIVSPSQQRENSYQLSGFDPVSWDFSMPKPLPSKVSSNERPSFDAPVINFSPGSTNTGIIKGAIPLQVVSKPTVKDSSLDAPSSFFVENPIPQPLVMVTEEEDEETLSLVEEIESEDIEPDYEEEEIAVAKLKLILRSWKRRASRKRELRKQRQLAANAALNSIPLGTLVQLKIQSSNTIGEFDIDHALGERFKKHEQSWSRLNVSEEIAGTLSEKNPTSDYLCWKMIVFSQLSKPDKSEKDRSADSTLSLWLLSKLMPSNNDTDDDLLVSSPGLTIWKNWFSDQFCSDQTCCLSVVKEVNLNNPTETVTGASAIIFLVFRSIPWIQQKAHFRRLLESIPCGSSLPFLILSSSAKDEAADNTSVIVNELGLHEIDKSRISSFVIVSLAQNHQTGSSGSFFSDDRLREGLRWLASESPLQPVLRRVRTRELVLTHLSIKDTEASPNEWVLAFNEALDRSLASIDAAAKANPAYWPCPEISLVKEYLEDSVPENGWSSVERIGPIMSALQDSKLPVFEDEFPYLSEGSKSAGEIEIRRLEFRKSLITYLTKSSKLMGFSLALKETGIMLQSCRLELRGWHFHIIPNWAAIFRRVFNWRLMSLSDDAFSTTYVLESSNSARPFDSLNDSELGVNGLSSCRVNQPSLDELIEASFGAISLGSDRSLQEAEQALPHPASRRYDESREAVSLDLMEDDSEGEREFGQVSKLDKEADRLNKLLEKCNILQNVIDDKLSVYF